MPKIHIFFPLYDKATAQSETQRLRDVMNRLVGESQPLDDGNILVGCLAASAYERISSKVLSLEADGQGEVDAMEERVLYPMREALGRAFERTDQIGRYSIVGKILGEKGAPTPVIYRFACRPS